MHLVIGSDHAGYRLKQELGQQLTRLRHRVDDVGTTNELPVGYPDLAAKVVGPALALDVARAFVRARFSTDARHQRCLVKVAVLHRAQQPAARLALPPAPTPPSRRRT